MASNFDFLSGTWDTLQGDALACEKAALPDPRACAFYARRSLERTLKRLYAIDPDLSKPYQENLGSLIHEPTFKDGLPPRLFGQIRLIHTVGNNAVHSDKPVRQYEAIQTTRALHMFLRWAVEIYTPKPPTIPAFDDALLPKPDDVAAVEQTATQLRALEDKLKAKDETVTQIEERLAATEAELAKLKEQVKAAKAANSEEAQQHAVVAANATEAETRRVLIDALLKEAGWDPAAANTTEYEVTGMPNKTGLGYVDYVLWGDDGKPLAVVEAKKTSIDAEVGRRQAELYADCLANMTGRRPVIYYSNGYATHLWDDAAFGGTAGNGGYTPRTVQGFATKDELEWMVGRREGREDLAAAKVDEEICGRYYQQEAIQRVMESWQSRQRKTLLVMATGTGKTRTSVGIVDILMRLGWARRVLFMADRTALVRQAQKAFKQHLPQISTCNLVEDKDDTMAKVIFSTYPTMANSIDDAKANGLKRFGPSHFDLVIIDEAHRSVYQKYQGIFTYFDSLLLGLTATPRDQVDRNTYKLFELESGVPTYAYELEKAVADGFLVPPKAVSVPLKFLREGVSYDDLPEEEREEYETKLADPETGEIPDHVDPPALNQWLFNEDTVDQVLKHLMQHGAKIEGGDKLGKTIIFAKSRDHAQFIEKRFNYHYPHLSGKFLRVIEHTTKYADTLIDQFGVATKDPVIAVSIDMLDTGIDVPEVLNLVYFKMVRSRIKFWQMLGRGTRLCPELLGPGQDKTHFMVFDYCQNLEFFKANPEGVEANLQEPVSTKVFKRRLDLATAIGQIKQPDQALVSTRTAVLDELHATVSQMNPDNFLVRPHRQLVERFMERNTWKQVGHTDHADLREHVSSLPSHNGDDEFARRFDLLMLSLQLSILEDDPKQADYQKKVKDIAVGLEEKRAIPSVAKRLELIQDLQTDSWWEDVTLEMLEKARVQLRDLIRFVDPRSGREQVYTDFTDQLGDAQEVNNLVVADPGLANYRLKVERFIRDHQDHITIQRLMNNEPVTPMDIKGLEQILFGEDGVGTREQYKKEFGDDQPLGLLVRKIVGLSPQAAKSVFADFLRDTSLSADQITFIDQVIDRVCANGFMEPEELFGPPFNGLHQNGVVGVFKDQAEVIVDRLKLIKQAAMV